MTGEVQELEKESFWREHQDTLVKIREELASGKKSRSRYSPAGGVRKKTPISSSALKNGLNHPPFGKYRRTPSPYLPKLSPQPEQQRRSSYENRETRPLGYEVIPPVKPKIAFSKSKVPPQDYDSWGEESDDDEDEDEEEDYGLRRGVGNKYDHQRTHKQNKDGRGRRFKPQPYPSPMPAYMAPQIVYGAPFPVYYPPPPQGAKKKKKPFGRQDRAVGYKDKYNMRRAYASQSGIPVKQKNRKSKAQAHQSMPMFATPMMPAMTMMFPPPQEEEEDSDEDEMPYNHPLYVPSLYACEDLLGDHLSELISDIARESLAESASDYVDEQRLKRDPLEDFLTDLIQECVRQVSREVVRDTVVQMAEDYLETEVATGVVHQMVDDYLDEIAPDLLEETVFDIMAEEFIESEVIASEVKEEAQVIARETIQHYDTKVMRREFKEVSMQAKNKLADVVIMEYILNLMSQQGKLWTEADHHNKYLDDLILSIDIGQMLNVQKQRDKTTECKPLHKLHEKVVSDVALDAFLQHLTRSLDEDLADVDEYERGVEDGVLRPIPLIVR
ncbi:uncharacterized protein LOC101850543 isoform X2 [Aplysia californica]|uniref:Uncharacterized protein LOC101850543 isoform X2 n=1 Tax=Aplysia californica TaxID=6500 RepID=A0ABM0ZVE1_APLCA|nr:uncharacterized protein LOC101850543 isoform X2 [Aplysia californica]